MRSRLVSIRRLWCLGVAVCLWVTGASTYGTPYWIEYDANNPDGHFPEQEGWTRIWGNWEGQFHGTGAVRTLHDGTLTYDSLYDDGVYDFSEMVRPGQIDPSNPQERFVLEFRLRVNEVHGYMGPGDPAVGVSSDDAWQLGFEFAEHHIRSVFEGDLEIPFAPGVFHDYRVESADMRTHVLYIDGANAHEGALAQRFFTSRLAWGDAVQGATSVHDWQYFRFGVVSVPEPTSVWLWCLFGACYVHRRWSL